MKSILLAAVFVFAMVHALNASAGEWEPVVIEGCTFDVTDLTQAIEVEGRTYDKRLTLRLTGRNFHIRALDPVIKLGNRAADDFRIFSDEQGAEVYFYGTEGLAEGTFVSVAYPWQETAVYNVKVPVAILNQL